MKIKMSGRKALVAAGIATALLGLFLFKSSKEKEYNPSQGSTLEKTSVNTDQPFVLKHSILTPIPAELRSNFDLMWGDLTKFCSNSHVHGIKSIDPDKMHYVQTTASQKGVTLITDAVIDGRYSASYFYRVEDGKRACGLHMFIDGNYNYQAAQNPGPLGDVGLLRKMEEESRGLSPDLQSISNLFGNLSASLFPGYPMKYDVDLVSIRPYKVIAGKEHRFNLGVWEEQFWEKPSSGNPSLRDNNLDMHKKIALRYDGRNWSLVYFDNTGFLSGVADY